ncbi:MAG: hypothetical protein ABL967_05390 [Bryobacteraceae bacterium]
MLRTIFTLVLVVTAEYMGFTPKGEALLGPSRNMVMVAIGVMGVLQIYRAASVWQARMRGDRLKEVEKKPLGI